MARKTMKVTVTKDAKKLWSCNHFKLITSIEHQGKLPKSAGEEMLVYLPGETPSPFCQANRAFEVAQPPKTQPKNPSGYKVCEHQIDIPGEE